MRSSLNPRIKDSTQLTFHGRLREHLPASHEDNGPPSPPTPQRLFDQLKTRIITATGPYCCVHLDGIDPDVGYQMACSLCEDEDVERRSPRITYNPIIRRFSFIMASHIHNCVATWAFQEKENARVSGFFTQYESFDLQLVSGSRKCIQIHDPRLCN